MTLNQLDIVLPLCSVFGDAPEGKEIDHTALKAHCHLF